VVPDRIEREVVIQAPVERVWAVLTQAQHVAKWFAFAGVEVDLRPGGSIVMRWEEHGTFHARVERVDPPRFFSYRWALSADEQPRDGNSTLVEFTLSREGGATRLRVVESGFAGLDGSEETRAGHVADNRAGWDGGLDSLREYVAQLAA
jgi:uncharacterized protein YndB with AHSA1/START domain